MLLSHRNIRLVRIFLALLVLIASSGATTVLHRCTMQAPSCCSSSCCANHDGCDQPVATRSGHLLKSDFTCHTNTIIGGVALNLALLDKEHKTESQKSVVSNVVCPSFIGSVVADSPSHTLFVAQTISSPSVEKCVLFSTFLI